MKRLFTAIAATVLATSLSPATLLAQDYAKNTNPIISTTNTESGKDMKANESLSSSTLAKTNPKLTNRFTALFPAATQEQWRVNPNSICVSFLNKGQKARAGFTPQGKINYLITDYSFQQLPQNVRNTINKDYTTYQMINAIEIKAYETIAYQVILEGEDNFITLKFTSDGVEKIANTKKTNSKK